MKIEIKDRTMFVIVLTVCFGLYVAHFVNVIKYGVNIFFWDEWQIFSPTGIIANPSLSELFTQHNEHRIVTTKLLILLLYYVNGNNVIVHLAVNFVIYGLLIAFLAFIIKRTLPPLPVWIWLSFFVFLFSTVSWENHSWAFQTQFHFAILFLLISVWFLFKEEQSWRNTLVGVFFSLLLVYSLSSGIVEMIAVLICYSCFKLLRLGQSKEKQREILQLCSVLLITGSSIALYFIGYIKPEHHPPYALPYQKVFWDYFLNLLSNGFGYSSENINWGLIILLFTVVPIIGELWQQRLRMSTKSWLIITSILAILVSLASITVGRANFGIAQAKLASRYTEIVIILIPLSVAMWMIFLNSSEKLRNYLLIAFWLFCAISFRGSWNFHKSYSHVSQQRKEGVNCIKNYIENGGEVNCPTISFLPLNDDLDFGKKAQLSPIKEIFDNQKQ